MPLTDDQLAEIQDIAEHPGWKLVKQYADDERERLYAASIEAKDMHIQNGNVTIIQSASQSISNNLGQVFGMGKILKFVEKAKKRRENAKEEETEV